MSAGVTTVVSARRAEQFAGSGSELSTTQILATSSHSYREFVVPRIMNGEDAVLMNIFIAFCHTNLAHNRPDRYGLDDVQSAFHSHPEISMQLARLFRAVSIPPLKGASSSYAAALSECRRRSTEYNTGHKYLDGVRRTIFSCCLEFIVHTLKTNFFVMEKQAARIPPRSGLSGKARRRGDFRSPGGNPLPGHLLFQPLRLRLPYRFFGYCPWRLAYRHCQKPGMISSPMPIISSGKTLSLPIPSI